MRRFWTIAATVALLTSFFEAPYFHLHGDQASDHALQDHLGQGLTLHTHFSIPQHRADHSPEFEASGATADGDAIFLAQTSSPTHWFSPLAFLPWEAAPVDAPESVPGTLLLPAYHSHDPPFVVSSAPRPPPA